MNLPVELYAAHMLPHVDLAGLVILGMTCRTLRRAVKKFLRPRVLADAGPTCSVTERYALRYLPPFGLLVHTHTHGLLCMILGRHLSVAQLAARTFTPATLRYLVAQDVGQTETLVVWLGVRLADLADAGEPDEALTLLNVVFDLELWSRADPRAPVRRDVLISSGRVDLLRPTLPPAGQWTPTLGEVSYAVRSGSVAMLRHLFGHLHYYDTPILMSDVGRLLTLAARLPGALALPMVEAVEAELLVLGLQPCLREEAVSKLFDNAMWSRSDPALWKALDELAVVPIERALVFLRPFVDWATRPAPATPDPTVAIAWLRGRQYLTPSMATRWLRPLLAKTCFAALAKACPDRTARAALMASCMCSRHALAQRLNMTLEAPSQAATALGDDFEGTALMLMRELARPYHDAGQ